MLMHFTYIYPEAIHVTKIYFGYQISKHKSNNDMHIKACMNMPHRLIYMNSEEFMRKENLAKPFYRYSSKYSIVRYKQFV